MIGLAIIVVATGLIGQPPELPPPAPVTITSEAFPGLETPRSIQCAQLFRGQTLRGSHHFGGISSFRLHGDRAYLLSDAGGVFVGDPIRDAQGWIVGFDHVEGGSLLDKKFRRMGKKRADWEGLDIELGGTALVRFENQNRIDRFEIYPGAWVETDTLLTSDAAVLGANSGFEGMTQLADGRIIVISEGVDDQGRAIVMTQAAGGWSKRSYKPAAAYAVTDLATDPLTGDLLILERAFSRAKGPRARLVRVAADTAESDEDLSGAELARLNFFHGIDNMEGIIAERTKKGQLRVHLISDDNFRDQQRTVLLGLLVDEADACQP